MTIPSPEDFEAVRELALTSTPDELIGGAMDFGAALLAHYDANLAVWGQELAETVATGRGSEDAQRLTLELARNIASGEAEKVRVLMAFDLLAELNVELPPAPAEVLERIMASAEAKAEAQQ